MQTTRLSTSLRHQRGAVLLVSLILLLVMSMIAVTSLSISSLEEKMAINTQHQISVFQAAETAIDHSVSDNHIDDMESAMRSGSSSAIASTFPSNQVEASVVFSSMETLIQSADGDTPDATEIGTSWIDQDSGGSIRNYYFEAQSTSSITGSSIGTTLIQGFKYGLSER